MTSEYPTIKDFQFVGNNDIPIVGSPIASATTIAPNRGIHHVTGTTTIQTITIPWDGFSGSCFLIADGLWALGTSGNINAAVTVAVGNVILLTYDLTAQKWFPALLSSTGGITSILPFVANNTGAGNGVITGRKTPTGSQGFLEVTGGSSQRGSVTNLASGYAGAGLAIGSLSIINTDSTGTSPYLDSNVGVYGTAGPGVTGKTYVGVFGEGNCRTTDAAGVSYGVVGWADGTKAENIGVWGQGFNGSTAQVGVLASIGSGNTTRVNTALLVDNQGLASPIAIFKDNDVSVFTIDDGGNYKYDRTITAAGTTGNQVINKAVGTVNIAAAGTTVMVTNSLCTTSSIIFCTLRTNDTTASIKNVVPGSGSFVINIVACNAEVSIGFMVTN